MFETDACYAGIANQSPHQKPMRKGRAIMEYDEGTHRKRLAQILRYIASMHHSLDVEAAGCSFVQPVEGGGCSVDTVSDFFQYENYHNKDDTDRPGGVLCSTENFRRLLAMESSDSLQFASPPFSFYAASATQVAEHKHKRTLAGAIKNTLTAAASTTTRIAAAAADDSLPEKGCWLRITRRTSAAVSSSSSPPVVSHPDLRRYLDDWLAQTPQARSWESLLTKRRLEQAPKLPPTVSIHGGQAVKSFLRRYKKYLRRRSYQRKLEPIYNRLFEYVQNQQGNCDELVWGLGHAGMWIDDGDNKLVNGPILEVLVEVELARDGTLLVRPREHTGVALNREVIAALKADVTILQQLHRTVAELEPSHLSPGQPATYVPLLKRIAVQLSSGGSFQPASTAKALRDLSKLTVTEAWCLYSRPKPNSVWARDATAFADQLLKPPHQRGGTEFVLPKAAWSLTHGPGSLEQYHKAAFGHAAAIDQGVWHWISSKFLGKTNEISARKPLFPLPSSDAQNRIADLLLCRNYPAVVCEGPPGTGKTHSIANTICAYLCQGKRVLVTSKNASALSVLRNRLPVTVQELCVDVSMSESTGVRQLQLTVERLSNRLARGNCEMEQQKFLYLQKSIEEHEKELSDIDNTISVQSESIRQLVNQPDGQQLIELAIDLLTEVPWLMKSISKWSLQEVSSLKDRVASLVLMVGDEAMNVTGFTIPPTDALVSLVASKAGSKMSALSNVAKKALAALPVVGSLSGMEQHTKDLQMSLSSLLISGSKPTNPNDWEIILRALKHHQDLHAFEHDVWKEYQRKDSWPDKAYLASNDRIKSIYNNLAKAVEMMQISWKINVSNMIAVAAQCRSLDAKRSLLVTRIQSLAEELVNAKVVTELSRSFSNEAHSDLIRFSQIAGKVRFNKSQQPSKMSQRQRRRRQDYLDAFDRCCRFIPCWILTTSQISDFLPPECLFDLVINDETSQSDVTVLPGMLRGRQWLLVGDSKQVSPTETFISEEQIESLRAALPTCPLEAALLPGQSFFDLCAQAFPNGRVVLNEHFRCASEIIAFSNRQFYDGHLVPLRLPLKSDRITPSIVDVRVRDGKKVGKVNEKEAEEIVRRVQIIASKSLPRKHRSIGIISLMGDEQSRLIRGRLLDVIGPHLMARHNVLVGDPPAFQGSERDIIFLSMVCSRGKAPTQSQLFHFQRANVALSRARDQCILVRSLDITEVPSNDDVKIPIIEFFQTFGGSETESGEPVACVQLQNSQPAQLLLAELLTEQGFTVRSMGIVWKNGICIEHPESDMRAAVMVDCAEELLQHWHASYSQQKAIERVGWKCLRVDILSLLTDCTGTLDSIIRFLSVSGVEAPPVLYDALEDEDETSAHGNEGAPIEVEDQDDNREDEVPVIELVDHDGDAGLDPLAVDNFALPDAGDIVIISTDDEEMDSKPPAKVKPEPVASASFDVDSDDVDASNFGCVLDLAFLRGVVEKNSGGSDSDEYKADQSDGGEISPRRAAKRRRKYRRVEKYQRDGSWYPNRDAVDDDPEGQLND